MAAELPDPRVGTLLENRYRLEQRLAAGGMGVVYRGELVAIGKPVAIKFLHDALVAVPDLVKRFQREALTLSRLAHPHLVSVVDSGVAGGVPFLVMDFVSGRSLADLLAEGPLPAARAVALTRQILAGVRHAHGAGIVHRDLKPDNILLLDDVEGDFVKILDFGLAKVLQSDEGATQLTNTGFALGTPSYMSPEQARGTESDERSDLYAVGVMLYQMVTGRRPFVADSPLAVLRMHMDDAPAPPSTVAPRACSPALERAILRAMAKEPAARFASAAEFAQSLAATREAGEAPEAAPRRRGFVRLVGAAVLCLGGVLLLAQLSQRRREGVDVLERAKQALPQLSPRPERRTVANSAGALPRGAPSATRVGPPPPATDPAARPAPSTPHVGSTPAPSAAADTVRPTPPSTPVVEPATAPPMPAGAPPTPATSAVVMMPTGAPPTPAGAATMPAGAPPTAATEGAEPKSAAPEAALAPGATTAEAPDDEDDDGDEPVAPRDTPGARLEEEVAHAPPTPATPAPAKPRPPTLHEASRLLDAGRVDEAIQALYAVRRRTPKSATTALLLGHAYFTKLWRTDGLREYNNALQLSPGLRHNRTLLRNAIAALDDPTYRLARAVLKKRIGKAALPELRRAAKGSKNGRVQQRAARLVRQLSPPSSRSRRHRR